MKRLLSLSVLAVSLFTALIFMTTAFAQDCPECDDPIATSQPDPPSPTDPTNPPPIPTATDVPPTDDPDPTDPMPEPAINESGRAAHASFAASTCENIVSHLATPVRVLQCEGYIASYWVGSGSVRQGPAFPSISALEHTEQTVLYDGINPGTNKPVLIVFYPSRKVLQVRTFYADTEYDQNKAYIFDIDFDNNVSHVAW